MGKCLAESAVLLTAPPPTQCRVKGRGLGVVRNHLHDTRASPCQPRIVEASPPLRSCTARDSRLRSKRTGRLVLLHFRVPGEGRRPVERTEVTERRRSHSSVPLLEPRPSPGKDGGRKRKKFHAVLQPHSYIPEWRIQANALQRYRAGAPPASIPICAPVAGNVPAIPFATLSASAITRSTLPPASFATSPSLHPRRISSASNAG